MSTSVRGGAGGGGENAREYERRGLCNKIQFQTIRIAQAPKTMLHNVHMCVRASVCVPVCVCAYTLNAI